MGKNRRAGQSVCPGCMRPCNGVCPRCGEHPEGLYVPRALEPGHALGSEVILGRALEAGETSIRYIGYDQRQKRRILVEELFAPAYMARGEEGTVCLTDGAFAEELRRQMRRLEHMRCRLLYYNNTVYQVRHYPRLPWRRPANGAGASCFAWSEASIIGSRKEQQDASRCCLGKDWVYAVLCDGMGGLPRGAVASRYCVEQMVRNLPELLEAKEPDVPQLLRRCIQELDVQVAAMAAPDGTAFGCGTTLVCAFVRESRLYYASVGDSHLYLIRGTGILQLNEEQNLRSLLTRQGEEAKAAAHPQAGALTSYIGMGGNLEIDCVERPCHLERGDMLLLCSDGVYNALTEKELTALCGGSASAAAAGIRREIEAKALPRQDNATCVLLQRRIKG